MAHKTQTLSEAMADFKITRTRHIPAADWKKTLPEGSHWQPGFPGQPGCKKCLGLGYLTLNVGVHHPQFGKLIVCECVPAPLAEKIKSRVDKLYERHGKA